MEAINKCVDDVHALVKEEDGERKPKRSRTLSWLNQTLLIFAIAREAINDSDKLINNFTEQKRQLQIQWNHFQEIYKFGEPFVLSR